jgi:type IV secretory pathway VirB10-like protein
MLKDAVSEHGEDGNANRKEVNRMKKLLVLFIAISFFTCFTLVACGPSGEQKPPAAKEEAKPAPAPAPEKAAPAPEPAKPGEAPAPAPAPAPAK